MKIESVSAEGVVTLRLGKNKDGSFRGLRSLIQMMGRGDDVDVHWLGPTTSDWWKGWDGASPASNGRRTLSGATLEVTEDHLKLFRASYMGWSYCEFGATEVNPKRPYGNSFVLGDIAELIGITPNDECEFTEEEEKRMLRLHRETQQLFEIVVCTQQLELGRYRNTSGSFGRPNWVPV